MKNKSDSNSRRRRWQRSRRPRNGMVHVSQGLAHALAWGYFQLARGTAEQRQAASDFEAMVLTMKGEAV